MSGLGTQFNIIKGCNKLWDDRAVSCHSPFSLAVFKLLDRVAKHVLQGTAEWQTILLVHVEGQHTHQQHCRGRRKQQKNVMKSWNSAVCISKYIWRKTPVDSFSHTKTERRCSLNISELFTLSVGKIHTSTNERYWKYIKDIFVAVFTEVDW